MKAHKGIIVYDISLHIDIIYKNINQLCKYIICY